MILIFDFSYGPYLASALQQFFLVFIIVFFRFRSYRKRRKEEKSHSYATDDDNWTSEAVRKSKEMRKFFINFVFFNLS